MNPTQQTSQDQQIILLIADHSPEFKTALHYASIRAKKNNDMIALLYIIEPDNLQFSLSIEEYIDAEKEKHAKTCLKEHSDYVEHTHNLKPKTYIKNGDTVKVITDFIQANKKIRLLVLGAKIGGTGPGPIVSSLFEHNTLSNLHIPVTVIPENYEIS